MRRLLVLLTLFTIAAWPALAHGQLPERIAAALHGDTFESVKLAHGDEPVLDNVLSELIAEHNLTSSGEAFHRRDNDQVLVVPLKPTEHVGRTELHTLFFDRATGESYFLLLAQDPISGSGIVKFWGSGPTEIIIDSRGIYYSPDASESTFRLRSDDHASMRADANRAVETAGISDNLLCLARLLGITMNPTNLETKLSSIVCTTLRSNEVVRNLAELVLIGGHCFSAVNCLGLCPASNALCLTGLAKWVSCGIAECSTPTPAIPALLSPANGATVAGTEVMLSWNAVTGATKYQTQMSRDASFSNPTTGSETSGTTARWTGLWNDGSTWYWRARAGNSQAWSQWSASRYFVNRSSSSVPSVPALSSPANGAWVPGSVVTLFMNPVTGATKYQTQLSRDASFSSPITGGEYTSPSAVWSGFRNDGSTWYWRARAGNSQGWSQWSASRYFVNRQ